MSKIPVQIQIPTHSNDNVEFGEAHHDTFKATLLDLFGGFSLLPGTVSGGWVEAGKVYPDRTLVFVVDVPGIIASRESVWAMVEFAKAHYTQLAIRITYLNVSEIL